MSAEDWLVRGTAWSALLLYVCGKLVSRRGFARLRLTTLGCAALLVHFIFAFQFRHGWSHTAAYLDTARQTAALTGLNWGGGIYLNYLFALVWISEVLRSWADSVGQRRATRSWIIFTRGFFLFMFLNASVIFVHGPIRWFGLVCCLALVAAWLWPHCGRTQILR